MADLMDHVAYLSQEIGPRPAGTEEEQQAALYITEQIQREAGLPAVIEDFTGTASEETPRSICAALTLIFGILALVLPVAALPAAFITIVSAVLYVAEALGTPLLSRFFSRGVSQNVVARYTPGYSPTGGNSRRRKIVVVAHYDSGKNRPLLKGPVLEAMKILKWVIFGAFIAAAVLLLLKATVFAQASGAVSAVLLFLIVVALVLSALPLVQFILHKTAQYIDGANCNAAGVAALIELAARVGRGRTDMSNFDIGDEKVSIHGKEAAYEAGVVPEGASLSYDETAQTASQDDSPAARLLAAKAAVAAVSGKPVSDFISEEVLQQSASTLASQAASAPSLAAQAAEVGIPIEVNGAVETVKPTQYEQEAPAATSTPASSDEATEAQDTSLDVPTDSASDAALAGDMQADGVQAQSQVQPQAQSQAEEEQKSSLPAWFVQAQKKAKRSEDSKPVQRSRYADALDAAVSESAQHFEEANNALRNSEQRLAAWGGDIVEVKPPATAWEEAHPELDGTSDEAHPELDEASKKAPEASEEAPENTEAPLIPEFVAPEDTTSAPSMPSFLTQPPKGVSTEGRTSDRVEVSAEDDPSEKPPAPVFVDAVTSETAQVNPAGASEASARQPIVLPAIDTNTAEENLSVEAGKQRAPLAHDATSARANANLRAALPSIDPQGSGVNPALAGRRLSAEQLRASLPSLSGAFMPKSEEPQTVSRTGSFVPVGTTSSFGPVGDELLENVDPEDIYVDDADDSGIQDTYTNTGAFADSSYVEMPKSRIRRLMDRFHKKKDEDNSTPQEWLDVDESFDARSVGAARGGWESFREEQDDQAGLYDEADSYDQDSQYGQAALLRRDATDPASTTAFAPYTDPLLDQDAGYSFDGAFEDEVDDFGSDEERTSDRRDRPWYGGAFSRVRMGRVDMRSGREDEPSLERDEPNIPQPEAPEMQKIYQFRNPDINTEVWFVALGSELSGNSGMKAFLAEHGHELRGCILIELEALGAGDLCLVEGEGEYRTVKTSSRMRRYARKASEACGVSAGSASLLWKNSSTSYAQAQGIQAMHLAGMDGAKPAFFCQLDDTLEAVDEELLSERCDYVMEILKNI